MPGRVDKRGRRLIKRGGQSARAHGNRPAAASRSIRPLGVLKAEPMNLGISDLPGEIRNLVYSYALSPSHGGPVRLSGGSSVGKDLALNLMRSCRSVAKEATGIFYGENRFRIDMLSLTEKMVTPEMKEEWGRYWEWSKQYEIWKETEGTTSANESLAIIGPKRLRLMRSLVFVYHPQPAEERDNNGVWKFPEIAKIAFELCLLPRRPHFGLSVANDLSAIVDDQKIKKTSLVIFPFIEQHMELRYIRSFSRQDILLFADWVVQGCRHRELDL